MKGTEMRCLLLHEDGTAQMKGEEEKKSTTVKKDP
jgi:hypothetical protein